MNKPVLIKLESHDGNSIVLNMNYIVYMCPQRLPESETIGTQIQVSHCDRYYDGIFLVKDTIEELGKLYESILNA